MGDISASRFREAIDSPALVSKFMRDFRSKQLSVDDQMKSLQQEISFVKYQLEQKISSVKDIVQEQRDFASNLAADTNNSSNKYFGRSLNVRASPVAKEVLQFS